MAKVFETTRRIRHGHTDPAGIVFYPRYYELIVETIEDFFADDLGMRFGELHLTRRMGLPTVHIETSFLAPSYCDDELLFSLVVTKLGRSSATLQITASCDGERRLTTRQTIAHVQLDDMKAVPFDEDLHNSLAEYLQSDTR